jgi:TRAP-type transport system periplasmic protein
MRHLDVGLLETATKALSHQVTISPAAQAKLAFYGIKVRLNCIENTGGFEMRQMFVLLAMMMMALPSMAKEPTYKIRWVLAHEPSRFFEDAAKQFSARVSKETNGDVQVIVQTAMEFAGKPLTGKDVFERLQKNELEMSQTYTTYLGVHNHALWVLDMPFLFKNHEHAAKVLDGQIGDKLLQGLQAKNMQGLSFTYSGGYRIIPSLNREIHAVEDFKGLKIGTTNSPVAHAMFKAWGAEPVVPVDLQDSQLKLKEHETVAVESTFPRYEQLGEGQGAKIINDTHHSLFLTALIINKAYFDKLPLKYQKVISSAARDVAKIERQASVDDGLRVQKEAVQKGYKIIKMSDAEQARLEKATEPVYKEFAPKFGQMVSKIKAAGK